MAPFEFIELFNFLAKIFLIRKYYFGLGNTYAAAAANPDLFISGGQIARIWASILHYRNFRRNTLQSWYISLAFSGIYSKSVFLNQQRTNKQKNMFCNTLNYFLVAWCNCFCLFWYFIVHTLIPSHSYSYIIRRHSPKFLSISSSQVSSVGKTSLGCRATLLSVCVSTSA